MSGKPVAILLMGPTATGKTALAVELVKKFHAGIVSVDSAMVYRGMDIGTAKPDADVLQMAPHRLIDILDPAESYSAARFRTDALQAMAEIGATGRIPLLVGGTMLYFSALQYGLSSLPASNPELRAGLDARAAREGWAALHAELARLDPAAGARIHPNDPQRIQRALEVYYLTGRPLSELQGQRAVEPAPYRFVKLALGPTARAELHGIIEKRFRSMLQHGLVDEVKHLRARGDLRAEMPSMRAVGYRQLWRYLEGRCTLEQAVHDGIVATRRYAKRQLTWLRSEPDIKWFDAGSPQLAEKAGGFVGGAMADSGL